MDASFPIRIADNDRVLSDLDLHQIQNVVWLRLCSYERHIVAVDFEMNVVDESEGDLIVEASCKTELYGGSIVESVSVAGSNLDAIVGLGKELSVDVPNRLWFERTDVYRWIAGAAKHVISIASVLRRRVDSLKPRPRQTS